MPEMLYRFAPVQTCEARRNNSDPKMIYTGQEPHPVIPLVPQEYIDRLGPEVATKLLQERARTMEAMEFDRLRYGHELEVWKKADEQLADFRARHPVGPIVFMVLGGERSSKTEWKSKRLVQNMLARKNYIAWACHNTQASSRDAQQRKIYSYIPPEYRPDSGRYKQGKIAKVNYTPWGGFTTDGFALPDAYGGASECSFKFYGMDPRSLEGAEIDEGWMDEEAPIEWLGTLIGRAVTRNGIIFLTFVAKRGYTPLVRAILDQAKTIEETDGELLVLYDAKGRKKGVEKVPKVQENEQIIIQSRTESDSADRLKVKGLMVYFHTQDNPFGNYESMKSTLDGASRERILWQAYGVPSTTISAQFNFKREIHEMKEIEYKKLVEKLKNKGPRYQLIDPCPGRNWFMIWMWFWAPKRAIIYREWPSTGHPGAFIEGIGDPGPWAVGGNAPDGEKGDAQRPMRFGYERYIEEIAKCEGWWDGGHNSSVASLRNGKGERIMERLVDGRYAVSPSQVREGATTWIEQMSGLGLDFVAMSSEKQILSGESDGSVEMINAALAYDEKVPIGEFSPDLGRVNEPCLYVLETCPNVIYSLQNWTGKDKGYGASKDPIDCIRGAYLSEIDYMDEQTLSPIQPWMKQFAKK